MKVQKTQDYTLFKRIEGNRVVSNPHVNRLKHAMEEDPSTITYNPIIVNEKFEVIDGQHRLEAMQALDLPVHYIKVGGLDLGVVQRLNSVAKQWTPMDYAKSFRELGNESYRLYIEFKLEFKFNHAILLKYLSPDDYVTNNMFKQGKFRVEDRAKAWKYCSYLRDFCEYYDRAKLRNQASGFFYLIRSEQYDHKRMLQKLKQHAHRIQEQKSPVDYAREFERIYNYHSQKDPIRLF